MRRKILLVYVLGLLMLVIAACDAISGIGSESLATPSPEPTPPNMTPVPLFTVEPGGALTETRPVSQLRVWVPGEFSGSEQAGVDVLSPQINTFNALYPGLEIIVEVKSFDGPGGILNYLSAGQETAPSILPDLIAIPAVRLSDNTVRGLVYPIDSFLTSDALDDIYPVSTSQVRYDERTYGFPFALTDLTHLIYSQDVVTGTVPLQWGNFISDTQHTLALPADSEEGGWFGLQFYLANGGTLVNEAGQQALELEPLIETLVDISEGKANLRGSQQIASLDQAWQVYQLGGSNFVWSRSDFFLSQLPSGEGVAGFPRGHTDYLAVPGPDGPLTPLVNNWAWSVTTSEPARQALATELLLHLTNEENMSEWAALGRWLPTRRGVMHAFAGENPYYGFAAAELETADSMPPEASGKLLEAIGDAVFRVLASNDPPAQIAQDAVNAVQP